MDRGLEKGAQIVIHGSGPPSDRSDDAGCPVELDRCFCLATAPAATRNESRKSSVTTSGPGRLEPVVGAAAGGVGVGVVGVVGLGVGCNIPRALSTVGT